MKSKILIVGTLALMITSARSQNLILNGSFENNTATGNTTNLTTAWDATVSNSFEIDGGTMDLITANNCGNPSNGNWFVTCSPQGGTWPYMAFSFKLSTTLTFGAQYTLTFDKRYCGPNTSPIDIGLSNDSTAFGATVHQFAMPLSNTWSTEYYVFQAMLAAKYLTINVGIAGGTGTVGLDNFSLLSSVVGISENSNKQYELFPNPSNGLLNLSFPMSGNKEEIEIYNLLGVKIFQSIITNQETKIDLSSQPKGIYFVKINGDEKSYTEKISVE